MEADETAAEDRKTEINTTSAIDTVDSAVELARKKNRRQFAIETLALYYSFLIPVTLAYSSTLAATTLILDTLQSMTVSVVGPSKRNEIPIAVERAIYLIVNDAAKESVENYTNLPVGDERTSGGTLSTSVRLSLPILSITDRRALASCRSVIANYDKIVQVIDGLLKDDDIILSEPPQMLRMQEICRRPMVAEAKTPDVFKKLNPTWRLWYRVKMERLILLTSFDSPTVVDDVSASELKLEHRAIMQKCGDYDEYLQLFESVVKNSELNQQFTTISDEIASNGNSNSGGRMVFDLVKIMNDYCHARLDSLEDRLAIDAQLTSRLSQLLSNSITPELQKLNQMK